MEDFSSLFNSMESNNDLVDKMVKLLDRQTDHKLNPNVLLGIMGMFNLMSIMSVVKSNGETGIRDVAGVIENEQPKPREQSLADGLASLLKGGAGQPDLMGLLSNVASKKKMNPSLMLSLLSMLNNQGLNQSSQSSQSMDEKLEDSSTSTGSVSSKEAETKSSSSNQDVELKFDRKKGTLERS